MIRRWLFACLAAAAPLAFIACGSASPAGPSDPLTAEIRLVNRNLRRGMVNSCVFVIKNVTSEARDLCFRRTTTAYLTYADGAIHPVPMSKASSMDGCAESVTLGPAATKEFVSTFLVYPDEPLGAARLHVSVWLHPEGNLSAQAPVQVRRGAKEPRG
jgi:hypothetical protein